MARRGRESNVEELIDLASLLPWWVALILAPLSYIALHTVAQAPLPPPTDIAHAPLPLTGSFLKGIAIFGQYAAPLIFLVGAAVSGSKAYQRRRLFAAAALTADTADLQELCWQDFERLVGQAFRERGFAVTETAPGADGGIDLELRKDGELHLVQCKRWRARTVGVEIIRELYGVMTARGAVGGYVVSSGIFSKEARRFAAGRNIELWDGFTLKAVIRGASARSYTPRTAVQTAPACPKCGTIMVKRTARRGANPGNEFWGCPQYPQCRGTRPMLPAKT